MTKAEEIAEQARRNCQATGYGPDVELSIALGAANLALEWAAKQAEFGTGDEAIRNDIARRIRAGQI